VLAPADSPETIAALHGLSREQLASSRHPRAGPGVRWQHGVRHQMRQFCNALLQWWIIATPGSQWGMHHLAFAGRDELVAPGALRPYGGAPPAPRKRGLVRQPAAGFFIAGSSIEDMNGVYARVHTVRVHIAAWL
jgi:hypothetical protein